MTHRTIHGLCLLVIAIVVTTYGVYFVAIGTLNYERIQSAAQAMADTRVKAVPFKPPPASAPRQVKEAWYRGFNATQPVELDRRAGEFFTAPEIKRPFTVVVLAGAWISGAIFLVLSGCLRIWVDLPSVNDRRTVAYLSGATSLSVSVVSFCSRFVFSAWMPCNLLDGSAAIKEPNWVSWAYLQAMTDSTRTVAAWAVAIGLLSWFSIFAMTSAVRHATIREPHLHSMVQRFTRVTVWCAVPIVFFYFTISFALGRLPQPSWLIPLSPY